MKLVPVAACAAALFILAERALASDATATFGEQSEAPEFAFVLAQLQASAPAAAPLLGKTRLTIAQQLQLAPSGGGAGILERPALLKAFAGAADVEVGRALLRSVSAAAVLASLPREALAESFAAFLEDLRRDLAAA